MSPTQDLFPRKNTIQQRSTLIKTHQFEYDFNFRFWIDLSTERRIDPSKKKLHPSAYKILNELETKAGLDNPKTRYGIFILVLAGFCIFAAFLLYCILPTAFETFELRMVIFGTCGALVVIGLLLTNGFCRSQRVENFNKIFEKNEEKYKMALKSDGWGIRANAFYDYDCGFKVISVTFLDESGSFIADELGVDGLGEDGLDWALGRARTAARGVGAAWDQRTEPPVMNRL